MTLTENMRQAELSVSMAPWPETKHRTVRRLSNAEAAERATQAAHEFYQPLLEAVGSLFQAPDTTGALDQLGVIYGEILATAD